jgi:hypothetical protein
VSAYRRIARDRIRLFAAKQAFQRLDPVFRWRAEKELERESAINKRRQRIFV